MLYYKVHNKNPTVEINFVYTEVDQNGNKCNGNGKIVGGCEAARQCDITSTELLFNITVVLPNIQLLNYFSDLINLTVQVLTDVNVFFSSAWPWMVWNATFLVYMHLRCNLEHSAFTRIFCFYEIKVLSIFIALF